MRFLHLADLHFGKSIHGVCLLDQGDQDFWADRFLDLAAEIRPDAVVIAGDVYDRGAPSGAAVALLDRFLTRLSDLKIPLMLVAGNHDSGQRLGFGSSLLAKQHLHIAGTLPQGGAIPRVTLRDEHGPVTFWLLPYVFPALVSSLLGDERLRDYDTAVRQLLAIQAIDFTERNVLVAHQNVTCGGVEALRGGSESMVGGVGQIDYTAFDGFDYVALGHIHAGYPVGRETVRYAGSPLCYHFSETRQRAKGPVLVELGKKGTEPRIETLHIPPLHPMRDLRGDYEALRAQLLSENTRGEYLRIVLTDRRVTPEISGFLRELIEGRDSVLMELVSEYSPYTVHGVTSAETPAERPLETLFAEFVAARQGGAGPDDGDREILRFAGERLRTGDGPMEQDVEALLQFVLRQEAKS